MWLDCLKEELKDLKFQRFLFCLCLAFGENNWKQDMLFHSPWTKKKKVNGVIISLNSLLNHSNKKPEFCPIHQYPRGTTFFKRLQWNVKKKKILNTKPKWTYKSISWRAQERLSKDDFLATPFSSVAQITAHVSKLNGYWETHIP